MFSNYSNSSAAAEFRSDTFTTPTVAMFEALANVSTGDAVYDEDDTTKALEAKVAAMAGKEAGLFCVSGTLSNQIALRVNLHQPPHSIMCDYRGHVYVHEAGGLATLSQAMVQTIHPKNGEYLTLEDDIIPNFIPDDGEIHAAPTKVISLENTLHGMIFPLDEIKKIAAFCKANDVRLHLDGARLWNASVATGVSIAEYCSHFDSVSLCLSKTLGAPIGSVLVADRKFVNKANHFKKQNGGGIRQSGILAAMASVAIDTNMDKLQKTHENARKLGDLCEKHGIHLEHPVHTNMVFIDIKKNKMDPALFRKLTEEKGIKASLARITYHYQQSDESVEAINEIVLRVFEESKRNPVEMGSEYKIYTDLNRTK